MNEAMEKAWKDLNTFENRHLECDERGAAMWNACHRHTIERVLGLQRYTTSHPENDGKYPDLIAAGDIEALKEGE